MLSVCQTLCNTNKDTVSCIGDIFLHALELLFSLGLSYYFLWGGLSSAVTKLFRSYSHLIISGGLFLCPFILENE